MSGSNVIHAHSNYLICMNKYGTLWYLLLTLDKIQNVWLYFPFYRLHVVSLDNRKPMHQEVFWKTIWHQIQCICGTASSRNLNFLSQIRSCVATRKFFGSNRMQRVLGLQFSRSEVLDRQQQFAAKQSLTNAKVEHLWDSSFSFRTAVLKYNDWDN